MAANPKAIAFSCKDHGGDALEETAPTLRAMGHAESHMNGGGQVAVTVPRPTGVGIDGGETAYALRANPSHSGDKGDGGINTTMVVAYGISNQPTPKYAEDVMPTLDAKETGGGRNEAVAYGLRLDATPKVAENQMPTLVGSRAGGSEVHAVGVPEVAGPLGAHQTQRYDLDNHGAYIPMTKRSANATASEAHTAQVLRVLRGAIGAEAFSEWGLGVLTALRSAEILRPGVHGEGVRRETRENEPLVGNGALPREKDGASGTVRGMREAERNGRPSSGWRLDEQLATELAAIVSRLPHENGAPEEFLHGLWEASEGIGVLREALSAVQEVRRPAGYENQSTHVATSDNGIEDDPPMTVRRLTPTETERLQGFPDGWTLIPMRTKKDGTVEYSKDSPRYKACGNSMAVPCMSFIGQRISKLKG